MIRFEGLRGRAEFLSHLKGFGREVQELEYRLDPLTGYMTIISRGRSAYVLKHFRSDQGLLEELIRSSKPNCPFCPEAIEDKTPKFPPELAPEGRLRKGDCWALPALYAHADFNAIIVLGAEHFRRPSEMNEALLTDGLSLALEALRRAFRTQPELRHGVITMAYLPTAGSSLLHPHMQVLATPRPFNMVKELLAKSLEYYLATSRNFWEDLVRRERGGPRFLSRLGHTWWLTPFAPMRRYEVWGIVEGQPNLLSLTDEDVRALANGLSRVLRAYDDMGIMAFNFALLSGPLGEDSSYYFWTQVRICARFGLRHMGLSDFWPPSTLLNTDEIFEAPEDYAQRLKPYFA